MTSEYKEKSKTTIHFREVGVAKFCDSPARRKGQSQSLATPILRQEPLHHWILFLYGTLHKDEAERKRLMYEAYALVQRAVEKEPKDGCFGAHKW
ncbi:hypothetical protein ANCDUO_20672 [Ancylostoma duodenale]|uniref:Uncharacterized protein n=1 Tax=Ancylostoma duodenale TaxID=51022 RepID=A0A0C2FRF5_9BILA|nr:hypothetical protein ANCDUO_20672 [Ancylostoma duodenale]